MEINKAMKRALVSLGALAVFGVVLVMLVANDMPLTKEFVGAIAGGIVSIAALVYAGQSKDDAKQAKDGAEQARAESQAARHEASKTERDKKRDRKREVR